MESLQGERNVFYACSCKKADKWPTQHGPGLFYKQLQRLPCTVSQRGGPTLSTSTEPIFKTDCANWWHTSKNWRRQKASSVVKGLSSNMSLAQSSVLEKGVLRWLLLRWFRFCVWKIWCSVCLFLVLSSRKVFVGTEGCSIYCKIYAAKHWL